MQNKNKLIKAGVAGVAATAIAIGAIYIAESQESSSQFSGQTITAKDYAYMNYVSAHGKSYSTSQEYKTRQAAYETTDANIKAHNSDPENTTAVHGHNYLSDYSAEEYGNMKGYNANMSSVKHYNDDLIVEGASKSTTVIDWVTNGKVTAIQNQGQCGSCWTFSAAGAIGSAIAIKNNSTPVDYSEQQIVDCDTTGQGCSGGLMDLAFTYVETHPLELSTNYPYKAANGTCTYNAAEGTGSITSYKNVPKQMQKSKNTKKYSTGPMKRALKIGPVSVGIAASSSAFQTYKSGILKKGCDGSIDHGVLAVGWGIDASLKNHQYLLVKNQWGTAWGEAGYIKLDIHNTCQVLTSASYPIV